MHNVFLQALSVEPQAQREPEPRGKRWLAPNDLAVREIGWLSRLVFSGEGYHDGGDDFSQ